MTYSMGVDFSKKKTVTIFVGPKTVTTFVEAETASGADDGYV